ncbi:methyl-accepting chemotaxis protein [Vreelandella rituensis]
MTVRLSWALVLAAFFFLVALACGLGFYALHEGAQILEQGTEGDITAQQQAFTTLAERMRWMLTGVVLMTVVMVVAVLWGVVVNVLRPLDNLVGYFERMAQGDLSQRIVSPGRNEIGRLYSAMAGMQEGIASTVGVVRHSGESIYHRAQQIAAGNNDLSARTEQQASSLEQTASSMEELASTVSHNADNTRQASKLAADATRIAKHSEEEVGGIVETMQDISASSHQVSAIVKVIDNIAFQTNILALNASVEAARAGEHGRGFAVVAEEVRNLASRSAGAAREIRDLIDASVTKVEAGTLRVNQAGETMQGLMAAVQRVSDIMDEIAAATEEQSNGISQVNQAVTQMDQVTQQNSQLVQQAAQNANELESEAGRLQEAVVRFRLAENGRSTGRALSSRPAATLALDKPVAALSRHRPEPQQEQWESF